LPAGDGAAGAAVLESGAGFAALGEVEGALVCASALVNASAGTRRPSLSKPGTHADRSTIALDQLPLLDDFLLQQKTLQQSLLKQIAIDDRFSRAHASEATVLDNFRLLQATDNLSLLACVDYRQPAHLLHPLPVRGGGHTQVEVRSAGPRHFVLDPYPFSEPALIFSFPARRVQGNLFQSAGDLQQRYQAASVETLSVTVSAA